MSTPYPHKIAVAHPFNGHNVSFGLGWDNYRIWLSSVVQNAEGSWDVLSTPGDPRDNGLHWMFTYDGPLYGPSEGVDPDGPDSPRPMTSMEFVKFCQAEKEGALFNYVDEHNSLCVSALGVPFVPPSGGTPASPATFSDAKGAGAFLQSLFAQLAVVDRQVVKK